jgi:hypothetical protein
MSAWEGPKRRPRFQLVSVEGNPSEPERRVIEHAVERLVGAEREATAPSLWLRAGRAQGRRLGMYDYRDRFPPGEAWRLSSRFPPGGREYAGRNGRGDSK